VVVVGAGVVGALQAYRLAERGHRVTLVDRQGPCRGTTGATFSWTSIHGKAPLFYHRFSLQSVILHKALPEELGVDVWWRPTYSLRPVVDPSLYEDAFATTKEKEREGYRHTWVDGKEAREMVPMLSPDTLGSSLCDEEGVVDPFRLVFAALHAARRRGAEFRFGEEVIGFEKAGDRITAVRTDKGTIPCCFVVNAAGPQAPDIARLAGVPIPFQRVKGEVLLTEKFPPRMKGVVGSVRQTLTGNFLIGNSQEPERLDTVNTLGNMRRMARNACRMFPGLRRAKIIRSYAGVRPIPADNISVVGPTQRCEGLLWAATHSGITLGPLLANVIADFVEGRRHPDWDERFSPDRFEVAV
jgi:sarcosine oxidase subunit beta